MIERDSQRPGATTAADVVALSAMLGPLGSTGGGDASADAALVDQIRSLEELKSAAAAAQARVTARFAASQRATQRAAGMSAADVGKGIGAQVALARRDSRAQGSRHLGVAEALCKEMPHTLAALEAGQISEWRATLVVRETACLTVEHRRQVDAELAAHPGGMGALGDRTIALEARRVAYRLDPHAVTDRSRKAEGDRRVTLRPAPDTMSLLTGLLPAKQGVAAWAALSAHADSRRAAGDPRSRGQVMADTLVERVTGQASADAVPVEVNLIVTDRTLFDGDHEPAELEGYGPLPAPFTRDWLRSDNDDDQAADANTDGTTAGNAQRDVGATTDTAQQTDGAEVDTATEADGGEADTAQEADGATADIADGSGEDGSAAVRASVWLRRLFTAPENGALVAMESNRRCFDGKLRRFSIMKDRRCRTPWCDAPIRHVDHPVPVRKGGKTTALNSQGLCEACNYVKDTYGWSTRLLDDSAVETTTPTGHTYTSRPPPALGTGPPKRPPPPSSSPPAETGSTPSVLEKHFRDLVYAA